MTVANTPFFSLVLHRRPHNAPRSTYPPFLPPLISAATHKGKWKSPLVEAGKGILLAPTELDTASLPTTPEEEPRFGAPKPSLCPPLPGRGSTSADPQELSPARAALKKRQDAVLMEHEESILRVVVFVGKKRVHKLAVVRNKCRTRCMAALRSVLDHSPSHSELAANDKTTPLQEKARRWAKEGAILAVHPNIAVYETASQEQLIDAAEGALERLPADLNSSSSSSSSSRKPSSQVHSKPHSSPNSSRASGRKPMAKISR